MPVAESIFAGESGLTDVAAIITTAVPEDVLKPGSKYVSGEGFTQTLTYKGQPYTPGALKLLTVSETGIAVKDLAVGFKFLISTKIFEIATGGATNRIKIIGGGEAIIWRNVVAIMPTVPASNIALEAGEAVVTTGLPATNKFYIFYYENGILQSLPLDNGTQFRQIDPVSKTTIWRKYAAAGEGNGTYEEINNVPTAAIASIANIDLANLGDLNAIVAALDTLNGNPFPAIGTRDGVRRIEQPILLNAQTDKRQNGVYLFSCVENNNAASRADRISPLLNTYSARIGRVRVLVWLGDRFGQNELYLQSDTPIGAATTQPRVTIETTPHYYAKAKPDQDTERMIQDAYDRLEEVEKDVETITEADPVALAEIERVTSEIEETIAALPPDRAEEIAALANDVNALDTTKASKASVDELNAALKKLNDAIALGATDEELAKAKADLNAAIAAVEAGIPIDKTVIEWENKGYKAGRIVVRQNAFFKCGITHTTGIDPLTDNTGHWSKFPQDGNTIGANRSPTVADKHAEGTIWEDLSFGSTTPLRFITTGDGLWLPLNQINLSRIRFYLYGTGSTYQSNLNNIKFFKADGTQMPNGWFVWGARSGLGGQSAGTNYTGQGITAQYNASGWCELEPSSTYDLSESITKVTGSTGYVTLTKVEFYYSNGGLKTFTPSSGNLATCDPPLKSRFGDATISAQGEILTAAKLTNPDSIDPGRVTGQAFVSAVKTIIQSSGAKQEIIRSTLDPDYTQEWETWRKVTEDLTAWTLTVTEYARTSQDSSMPMIVRTEPRRPPTHADATTNAQGEFVVKIPGGGEFVYVTSRSGGNNYATFPPDVYKEVASYYVDANDAVIPLTTMAQQVAAGSTALGIGAIAISTEAIAFVVDFYRLDNSKISYRVPLS